MCIRDRGAEPVGFVQSEDMEQLRNGAPAKIYAPNNRPYGRYCFVYTHPQSAQQGGYPDCDTCGGSMDYMPWHYATETERHLHACNECWPKVNPANPGATVPEYVVEALSFYAKCSHMSEPVENGEIAVKALTRLLTTPQQSGEWDGATAKPAAGESCLLSTETADWQWARIKYISDYGVVADVGGGVEAFISCIKQPEFRPLNATPPATQEGE